ncbi:MAG: glycosyltransferase family 4 protein [Patescibacteria group bacterium]
MKILFLSEEFPPINFGGSGAVAYSLASGLKKRGHDVFIITSVQKKSEQGEINFNGLKIFRIQSNYHNRWRAWLSLYNPQVVFKIEKIIKEIKPDIVHAHNVHTYLSYYCFKIAKKYAKAVFLTAHDVMLIHTGKLMPKNGNCMFKLSALDQIKDAKKRYNPFRNIIIKHYLKYVDRIFAVSNTLKHVLEINGIKNIETIYNGIDVNDWQINKVEVEKFKKKYNLANKKVIIFSARLIEAKGGDQLIESLSLVNQKFSNFILLVVGRKWDYTEKLKKLSDDFKIKEKIIFTNFLEKNELKSAYYSSDISVLPSLCFETFGMTNLEAMACKKPVISTYFGGPSEVVVDKETGYLIDPNNTELMAKKIIDLLKNLEKANVFGRAGHNRAEEKFSLNKQIEKILKWYNKYV